MRVVTTVHKAGYTQYGYRWLESLEMWPSSAEFAIYPEGFDLLSSWTERKFIEANRVKVCNAEDLPRLAAFKERHRAYRPPSWRHDIVRFSNKVFAAYDALYDYDGIGVWLDADCVTYNKIPEGYIEGLLGESYFAHFNRNGHYTETGMWIVNCAHPEHRNFLDTWLRWFETDAFKSLHEWHDCTTLDATLALFLRDERITTKSLSGEFANTAHPMAKADTAKFICHRKGARKALPFSPENKYAEAFFKENA